LRLRTGIAIPARGAPGSLERHPAHTVMPLYYFKLVDTHIVSNHGAHNLPDEAAARLEAIRLARSLREARPELIGRHCSISVTDEDGAGVCVVAVDDI
jgi:hypothetical protein